MTARVGEAQTGEEGSWPGDGGGKAVPKKRRRTHDVGHLRIDGVRPEVLLLGGKCRVDVLLAVDVPLGAVDDADKAHREDTTLEHVERVRALQDTSE